MLRSKTIKLYLIIKTHYMRFWYESFKRRCMCSGSTFIYQL